MIVKVTFKDPEALCDVEKLVRHKVNRQPQPEGIDDEDWEDARETQFQDVMSRLYNMFYCGEYVTLEVDLDLNTATVVPNKENHET